MLLAPIATTALAPAMKNRHHRSEPKIEKLLAELSEYAHPVCIAQERALRKRPGNTPRQLLHAVCNELLAMNRSTHFYIDARTAAAMVGASHTSALRWLKQDFTLKHPGKYHSNSSYYAKKAKSPAKRHSTE
jgi:hypothetical protein